MTQVNKKYVTSLQTKDLNPVQVINLVVKEDRLYLRVSMNIRNVHLTSHLEIGRGP